ncbi:hypothetical protein GCM10009821_23290 [Aeromicrobium halocynthiae]|uniref:Xaa-Pro dipeptidyl-peptidase-like domain-containing protein n=1 Tax=Aeromicrobium halocynthiae TaxID=560557 RepID=A0ABN2W2H0_9ACTN
MTTPAPFPVPTAGAVLHGELHRHRGVRRGAVLLRTPYDAVAHRSVAGSLAQRGWDCLVQDVRGRHGSTGSWTPYAHEAADGAATVAAATAAGLAGPWVLFGASYAAHTALETARVLDSDDVAAVVALVPALGLHETAHDDRGRPQHRDRLGWWSIHGLARTDHPPLPAQVLRTATHVAATDGPLAAVRWLGWDEDELQRWRRLWSARPLDLRHRYGALGVPLLVVTGDDDPFDGHARRLAAAWGRCRGPRATLLSGPWGHDLTPRVEVSGAGTGGPGSRILDWMAGLGPGPGVERRLDPDRREWADHRIDTGGAA